MILAQICKSEAAPESTDEPSQSMKQSCMSQHVCSSQICIFHSLRHSAWTTSKRSCLCRCTQPLAINQKSCILKLELVSLQPWLFSQIYLRKASATAIELPAGLTACAGAHNPSRQRNQSHVKASVFLSSVP